MRFFLTQIFSDIDGIESSGLAIVRTAYESARDALQSEAALTDADIDILGEVMVDALLSLYRAGHVDETKLSNYASRKHSVTSVRASVKMDLPNRA